MENKQHQDTALSEPLLCAEYLMGVITRVLPGADDARGAGGGSERLSQGFHNQSGWANLVPEASLPGFQEGLPPEPPPLWVL